MRIILNDRVCNSEHLITILIVSQIKFRLTSDEADLRSKLVDGRRLVIFPVALVDLAVWSFSRFFSETRLADQMVQWLGKPAGSCIRGFGFESRVRHGCRAVRPWLY